MDHDNIVEGDTLWQKLRNPEFAGVLASHFTMDVSMLWVDLAIGFGVAGALGVFVPAGLWHAVALDGAPGWVQTLGGAVIGPLLAVVTFVCSIGNVPMAAILWAGGLGFSGVLAFLYADLIVFPLLDVYRKYYGARMAAYITGIFFVTMALSAIVMDLAFNALHLVPARNPNVRMELVHFAFDYTFWLNLAFGALAVWLYVQSKKRPAMHCH